MKDKARGNGRRKWVSQQAREMKGKVILLCHCNDTALLCPFQKPLNSSQILDSKHLVVESVRQKVA